MHSLARATTRFVNLVTGSNTTNVFKNVVGKREFTRNLWYMSKKPELTGVTDGQGINLNKPSMSCSCGCGMKHVHTKSERELVEFLTEEILAERKAQKNKKIPTELCGFTVKYDKADVELIKQTENEKITISFNVNHTVDTECNDEADPNADNAPDMGEMRSKPRFEIDIVKGSTTLSFTCAFLEGTAQEGEYNDIFSIEELTIYTGEWDDKTYAVAGDVLDGYLYDLLMNFLEEKGISNDFAEKLSDLATVYEHSSYIWLLEGLSKFTGGK